MPLGPDTSAQESPVHSDFRPQKKGNGNLGQVQAQSIRWHSPLTEIGCSALFSFPFRHIGTASHYLATSPAPPINGGRNRNRVDRRAHRRMLASPLASSRSPTHNRNLTFSSFSSPPTTSLSTSRFCPFSAGDSVAGDFSCTKLQPDCLNAAIIYSSKGKRSVVAMVIPYTRESAWEQPPPDLASFLFKNRIVYLGMSPVPSVTELILAKFLYLQYEDEELTYLPVHKLHWNNKGHIQ